MRFCFKKKKSNHQCMVCLLAPLSLYISSTFFTSKSSAKGRCGVFLSQKSKTSSSGSAFWLFSFYMSLQSIYTLIPRSMMGRRCNPSILKSVQELQMFSFLALPSSKKLALAYFKIVPRRMDVVRLCQNPCCQTRCSVSLVLSASIDFRHFKIASRDDDVAAASLP